METSADEIYTQVFAQKNKHQKRLTEKLERMEKIKAQTQKLKDEYKRLEQETAQIKHQDAAVTYDNLSGIFQNIGIDIADKETFGKMMELLKKNLGEKSEPKKSEAEEQMEKDSINLFEDGQGEKTENGGEQAS